MSVVRGWLVDMELLESRDGPHGGPHGGPHSWLESGLASVLEAGRCEAIAAADKIGRIVELFRAARRHPEALLPGRAPSASAATGSAASRREDVEFAQRALAAEIAMSLKMSENAVRSLAAEGDTLERLMPESWTVFRNGGMPLASARALATEAASFPVSCDPATLREFDRILAPLAGRLTTGALRSRARNLRRGSTPLRSTNGTPPPPRAAS